MDKRSSAMQQTECNITMIQTTYRPAGWVEAELSSESKECAELRVSVQSVILHCGISVDRALGSELRPPSESPELTEFVFAA